MKPSENRPKGVRLDPSKIASMDDTESRTQELRSRRERREQLSKERLKWTWILFLLLTPLHALILNFLLPVMLASGDTRAFRTAVLLSMAVVYPVAEWWRRRFRLTVPNLASAFGGACVLSAVLNFYFFDFS